MKAIPSLPRMVVNLWQRLTMPSLTVTGLRERRQAQLLAGLYLVTVLIGVFLVLIHQLIFPTTAVLTDAASLALSIVVLVMVFCYLLSRSRWYRAASLIGLATICLYLYISGFYGLSIIGLDLLYYLIFPMMTLSLLAPTPVVLGFIFANIIVLATFTLVLFPQHLIEVVAGPINFMVFTIGVMAVFRRHRTLLDNDMRRERDTQERQFRLMAEHVRDVVSLIDRDGRIRYISPSVRQVMGDTPEQTMEMPVQEWLDRVHPDDRALIQQRTEQMLQTGVASTEHYRFRHRDGHYVWLEALASALYDPDGSVSGSVVVSRDVSERHHAEQQRLELTVERERVRLLRQFISDLSHDIRNPLATLSTSVYLLGRTTDLARQQHHRETIEAQIKRLDTILNDLLNISRLDSAAEQLTLKAIDLNLLAQAVADLYSTHAGQKRQRLTFTPDPVPLIVMVDSERLAQATENLVRNALNYTPEGGEIEVRTFRRDAYACLEVRDTGLGIDSADLPYIFDHFFRADRARSAQTGGVGLGLTIARRIVQAHGGHITVESEPGKGSVFCVYLPLTRR